ncbi:hypothetical protein Q9292_01865 [Methylophilus sp. VKM B-3414]|uniref:hypothetical protein n=1 Tax=Methylophilus sp. VKM B-3414 TaxID=3076121 RepID=UPI0028C6CB09|nr:hypothetical protein [Methylophilus sp. VKM B-3414]MDT7848342.1 hypothetical protein [Methylophilus sp. VKM B-3414]
MANQWHIPDWLEAAIRNRDKACVYCAKEFTPTSVSTRSAASWEHIINDETIISLENIALCCRGCNASKGQKKLSEWMKSDYCKTHGITEKTVSQVIKDALAKCL